MQLVTLGTEHLNFIFSCFFRRSCLHRVRIEWHREGADRSLTREEDVTKILKRIKF